MGTGSDGVPHGHIVGAPAGASGFGGVRKRWRK